MGNLVDAANESVVNNINQIALWLLLCLHYSVFSYFRIVIFVNVTEKTLAVLRQQTYAHLIMLPMPFYPKKSGELNSRIAADIALHKKLYHGHCRVYSTSINYHRWSIFLSVTSVKLTLFSGTSTGNDACCVFGRYIKRFSKEVQQKVAESNTIIEETLQGIANVKAFTNEFFEIDRYTEKTNQVKSIAQKGGRHRGAFASFIIFCLFGSIVAVIWFGVLMINTGQLSIGQLFTFVLYSVFIGSSVGGMADIYSKLQKAIGSTEHLLDLLEEKKEEIGQNIILTMKFQR